MITRRLGVQLQTRVNSLSLVPLFVDILEMIGLAKTIYEIFKSIRRVRGCNLLRLHGEGLWFHHPIVDMNGVDECNAKTQCDQFSCKLQGGCDMAWSRKWYNYSVQNLVMFVAAVSSYTLIHLDRLPLGAAPWITRNIVRAQLAAIARLPDQLISKTKHIYEDYTDTTCWVSLLQATIDRCTHIARRPWSSSAIVAQSIKRTGLHCHSGIPWSAAWKGWVIYLRWLITFPHAVTLYLEGLADVAAFNWLTSMVENIP